MSSKYRRILCISAVVVMCIINGDVPAREVEAWSFEKLRNKADVIIICKYIKSTKTGERVVIPGSDIQASNMISYVAVLTVLKGDCKDGEVGVLHLSAPQRSGLSLLPFGDENGQDDPLGSASSVPEKERVYMLFLSHDKRGLYKPVSGATDAAFSIREIIPPFKAWPKEQ